MRSFASAWPLYATACNSHDHYMCVAIYTTKLPVLAKEGFWKMAHDGLLDYAMLFGLISILIAGAGTWSLDERLEYRRKDLFKYPCVLMNDCD